MKKLFTIISEKRLPPLKSLSPLFLSFLIAICGVVAAFVIVASRSAQAGPGLPFGGRITNVFYCNCDAAWAITVADLSTTPGAPTIYLYRPGSTKLYPFGNILSPGTWVLGNRTTGGICRYWVGKTCAFFPVGGEMLIVGTSQ